ncbi:mucin-associated surface protein (MASP), putative [Trypanosoma cruzi marinkellei]|uniref:Mucin-associated surface protein (MASP), putative n=1 Tax=Trypanosoma cruzi marinkellei TaxID=85056 RepID=K2NIR4_TRYCR|nr:mucin-associated surface protein (MASP), putative [Trypanosoma cruzi marinkellei]
MAMMMTGRVLLVCALCVLWCGLSGISADDTYATDGSAGDYSLLRWRAQLRRECAEEVSRRTGGSANTFAVEECVRHWLENLHAVVDGHRRWGRQPSAVAAAAADDDDSTEDGRNAVSSAEDMPGTGAGSPDGLKVKSSVSPEPGQADTTPGGEENVPKTSVSLGMPKEKSREPSKEKVKEEKPTVENGGNESTDYDHDGKKVDNTGGGNPNEDREKKKGDTLQVEQITKTTKNEVKNGLEEKKIQTDEEKRKEELENVEEDVEDTVHSVNGQEQDNKGEGQKEGDTGDNKNGKELKWGGDTDGASSVAPATLQLASFVNITVPQNLEKKNNAGDTGGKRDTGRSQMQEAAVSSQAENLSAELCTEGEDASDTENLGEKKTQPAVAGNEQKTVGAKTHPEAIAAEKEAHNREEVRREEDIVKETPNKNPNERQTAGKDNAYTEAENTMQEKETEVEKIQETKAAAEEKEEPTGKKTLAAKRPKVNGSATTADSDSSTAVSHTTSPLLLLLVVACAAAAVVVAA